MPIRRRLPAAPVREVDAVSCFTWSLDGTDHPLGEPHFRDRQEAGRAWERVRRQLWAKTPRFTIPHAARIYDKLTTLGVEFVRWNWNHNSAFDLAGALKALRDDRANLAAFERTRSARAIRDYLVLFHADLDEVERTARELAALPSGRWKPYPQHLNVGRTYGHSGDGPTVNSDDHDPAEVH